MFERFNDPARKVLVFAHDEAKALQHGYVGTEHLLLGVLEQSRTAAVAINGLGLAFGDILRLVDEGVSPDRRRASGPRPYTPRAKRVLDAATPIATEHGDGEVGPEHILLAILESEDIAVTVLESLGADREQLRETVLELIRARAKVARKRGGDNGSRPPSEGGRVRTTQAENGAEGVAEEVLEGEDDADDDLLELDVDELEESAQADEGAQPLCPGCSSELTSSLRWRQFVVPGSRDESLLLTVVFCGACGHTMRLES